MSQLFSPFSIGQLRLKNRIVIAPMCQYSADHGKASDWHMIHLGNMIISGAGLLIIEATAVTPEGRISADDLGLWSDTTEIALQRVLTAIRQHSDMPVAIQLAHAGRKASTQAPWQGGHTVSQAEGGWQPQAPSALAFDPRDPAPAVLTEEEIQQLVKSFALAAQRAERIGINAIEVHAAHGYLLHQFLSPLANQRSDNYGGSLENRMRLPLEVFSAIRAAVPQAIPVGARISASDWVTGGWDLEQSIIFGNALRDRGCDYIHVSSGGLSLQQAIPVAQNYQIPFAEKIRQAVGLPVIAVGLITEPQQAETLIAEGRADLVALARAMLYDPRWPWHAAAELGAQVEAPKQYLRSQPHGLKHLFVE